jgi:hypothetical protein
VFLKCNSCPYETPTSFNGKYWSVGHFPEHLKESIECNSFGGLENTIPMDSSDISQASFTVYFIINVSKSKAPGVEPASGLLLPLIF